MEKKRKLDLFLLCSSGKWRMFTQGQRKAEITAIILKTAGNISLGGERQNQWRKVQEYQVPLQISLAFST